MLKYVPSITRDFGDEARHYLSDFFRTKIFVIFLNLSIKLPSYNNWNTKIFSKEVVWSAKRGFELSLLPEQRHGSISPEG